MYVHSILRHWASILISRGHFIEYAYCWEFVCELSEILSFFVFTLSYFFESEMSNLLLRTLCHCPFHHYIHYWCDFTPYLIWVDHHFSSYIHCFVFILVITCDSSHSLHPLVLFLHWPIPGLIFPLHHSYASHYQFDLLHHLIIDIIFIFSTFRSMVHELFYTCCILYIRAWVFYHWVFGPSFPSFLLTYHPSLRYVPCLKTTLAMGLMSCSTTPTWPSVWDLVDI